MGLVAMDAAWWLWMRFSCNEWVLVAHRPPRTLSRSRDWPLLIK